MTKDARIEDLDISPTTQSVLYNFHYWDRESFREKYEPIEFVSQIAKFARGTFARQERCGKLAMSEIDAIVESFGISYADGKKMSLKAAPASAKTLRDEFAMAALTGLLANPKLVPTILKEGPSWFEANAFAYADAMMEKRK
jgi:hypothetical protein